jgi:Ca2+-transporting ATPase
MAARNCIVRKLPSVETLGCTTVICSDKTGTLTTNQMCAEKFLVPQANMELKTYLVAGHSYTPVGEVTAQDGKAFRCIMNPDKGLQMFAKVGAICNESRLRIVDKEYTRVGEPTEAACRVLVEKLGCPSEGLNARCLQKNGAQREESQAEAFSDHWLLDHTKQAVLEFSRDRKSMSVLYTGPDKSNILYTKGAPESVLERCSKVMLPNGEVVKITPQMKEKYQKEVNAMAAQALRTLAFAVKTDNLGQLSNYNGPAHPGHELLVDTANFANIESDMTFVGLVGIKDPPRPECRDAIADCRKAGIAVVMITGDNKITAEAISTSLGIVPKGMDLKDCSFTGREFEALSDKEQHRVLRQMDGAVFSRTEPRHKQLIVKILKDLGEVTAMTGDGVNDAPALKQADIGVAMGIAGTEVAKEASDMVLVDDNFSTIVHAVEEGRSIYSNMKAFIRYLISSNIGEVASIFFTAAMGIPEGLIPVQLLWVNLVTDGPPATALGFNPPEPDVMKKPPRARNDSLISGWIFFRYMVVGIYVGFATVGILVYWYCFDTEAPDGHDLVTMEQLMNWGHCTTWKDFKVKPFGSMEPGASSCTYFTAGKDKASSLSLTVLVVIEMLNAFNALCEDTSLLVVPPWRNPYLFLATAVSIGIHFLVLYIPWLAKIFAVMPLTTHDWKLVMAFSFPVIIIDEILKVFGRILNRTPSSKEKTE